VLGVYQDRLRHWADDGRLRHALLFKNSGFAAGASLEHVHSQLVATPFVHEAVRVEAEAAERHFAMHRRCTFCELVRTEIAAGERLVLRTGGFTAICAYAGRQPYETWILPEDHAAHFAAMSPERAGELAGLLQELLARLSVASGGAGYNLILHTAPFGSAHDESYHWHWELLPRITQLAGLELGGGAYINPMAPERAAQNLRQAAAAP
jgi:UDPglucose--hexose-1-phosphate uridylyltransferase